MTVQCLSGRTISTISNSWSNQRTKLIKFNSKNKITSNDTQWPLEYLHFENGSCRPTRIQNIS